MYTHIDAHTHPAGNTPCLCHICIYHAYHMQYTTCNTHGHLCPTALGPSSFFMISGSSVAPEAGGGDCHTHPPTPAPPAASPLSILPRSSGEDRGPDLVHTEPDKHEIQVTSMWTHPRMDAPSPHSSRLPGIWVSRALSSLKPTLLSRFSPSSHPCLPHS